MSRVVHHEGWTEIAEPWEAGKYDPPMQEWLQLPASDDCPECGSTWFGTENARGYFLVRRCHDEHGKGCRAKFRPEVTPYMIAEIVSALSGTPRRFATLEPRAAPAPGGDEQADGA